MEKLCTKCHTKYPATIEYFYKHKNTEDGLQSWCKGCFKKLSVEWQKKNPEKFINSKLKSAYGITLEEYNQMLDEQNNCCKICGGINNGRTLHVDHNHDTSKVRGLLCIKCNSHLGWYERNKNYIIKYLET